MINQQYSEGDIRYAPNAPLEEENRQPSISEYTGRRHMNYSHIKYVVLMLSCLLGLSYVPGYLSIGTQEWQPNLMQVNLFLPETQNGMTLFFGWDSVYYYEGQTSTDLKDLDNELFKNDLENSGFYYIFLALGSLIVFLLPTICCRKQICTRLTLFLLSWLLLLFPIINYIVNTKRFMEDFEKNVGQEVFYKLHIGYGFYANFLGLLLIPVNHLLMYVS